MKKNFWYLFGYFTAVFIVTALYLLGIYGVVTSIMDRQIPFVPLIFILSLSTWRRVVQSQEFIKIITGSSIIATLAQNSKSAQDQELDKIMKRVQKFGGNN